jgi:hypothetical protein
VNKISNMQIFVDLLPEKRKNGYVGIKYGGQEK